MKGFSGSSKKFLHLASIFSVSVLKTTRTHISFTDDDYDDVGDDDYDDADDDDDVDDD